MKYLVITLVYILYSTTSFAQVDWSAFMEPDGYLQRLIIDPRISFSNDKNDFTNSENESFRAQLLTRYSLNQVSDRSILNLNIEHNLIYINNKRNLTPTANFTSNTILLSGSYSCYTESRRGIFLRAQPVFSYDNQANRSGDDSFVIEGNYGIGFGRLENVSTVYQAIRIDKNLYGNAGNDQESLYQLARGLRSIQYNNALDTRMRNVENQTAFLQMLDNQGYEVSTYNNIANAIDMFRFERPFLLFHGYEINTGISPMITNIGSDLYNGFINGTYARAINDTWHWTINAELKINLSDDNNTSFGGTNTITYLPTARTQISLSQSYFNTDNVDDLSLRLHASYFVSPKLSLFLNTSYNKYTSNFGTSDRSRTIFNHDMGLKYYIF